MVIFPELFKHGNFFGTTSTVKKILPNYFYSRKANVDADIYYIKISLIVLEVAMHVGTVYKPKSREGFINISSPSSKNFNKQLRNKLLITSERNELLLL